MPRPRRAPRRAGALLGDVETRRLVFVDGAFVAGIVRHSPRWKRASPSARSPHALADGDPALTAHLGKLAPASDVAVALNTALMGDGAVIRIAAGSTIERPLHLSVRRLGKARRELRALARRRRARARAPC